MQRRINFICYCIVYAKIDDNHVFWERNNLLILNEENTNSFYFSFSHKQITIAYNRT